LVGIRPPLFVRLATIERTVGIPRIASDSQPDTRTAAETGADTDTDTLQKVLGFEENMLQWESFKIVDMFNIE